ncbi:unnamed protein product [Parnassius mnemosyne]|uniref:Telomere-associated protein RIF1 n=1 Tax=Parnassius mnemosyne TaxID=213953 RepID=A0AAV1L7V2_9NEOP
MDISKLFKNVNNLNEYISASQDVETNYKNIKIQLNMSTVLALKKTGSLEIQYFNKCEGNGAAVKIFGLLLLLPSSKTWSLLGRELVSLLKYWLDALRKHLIFHNDHWWLFLQKLLQFIKEIRLKDNNKINNILVEETAECLLDLATHDRSNIFQSYKVLCLFNLCAANSSREIRFALRKHFDCYLIKLSTLMASCGDVAYQYSIMEALLRWLVPRQDPTLRLEAAAKWFPDHLYSRCAVDLFLERAWKNFFQDARDFLNAHNALRDLITSVICKKLTIGSTVVISGSKRRDNWLDINSETKCISIILHPELLEMLGSSLNPPSCETLVLTEANTSEVKLCREVMDIFISVTTLEPPQLIPSSTSITGKGSIDVKIVISSNSDMVKVDKALRGIFADKYQENNTRFSHPKKALRLGRHTGYTNAGRPGPWVSPSTASTSSLAHLHEKLAALPRYNYDKEPVSLCARPQLSSVTEVSEVDDHQSQNISTSRYGISQKSFFRGEEKSTEIDKGKELKVQKTRLSPAATNEKKPVSCLLVASVGSADESVLNDTLERLSKIKDYNDDILIDVLVQEALQSEIINHSENKALDTQEDFIKVKENITNKSPITKISTTGGKVKNCTVISNSTSAEESNNDIVEGTQLSNINFERRKLRRKNAQLSNIETAKEISAMKTVDEKTVEEFFSQHITENRNRELVISPTLAKRINETSSESSEHLDDCCLEVDMITNRQLIPDLEIVECLNFMIDKICNELDKCTQNLNSDLELTCEEISHNKADASKTQNYDLGYSSPKENNTKPVEGIKLKFKATKKATRLPRRKNKLAVEEQPNQIITTKRDKNAINECNENVSDNKESTDNKTDKPLIRRKRKLYSPKDEKCNENWNSDCENVSKATSIEKLDQSESKITCYKEIENERMEYKQKLRNRKTKKIGLSPKTKKMNDLFDKVKNNSENNEKIILVDKKNDVSIYNFPSDSEDSDFKINTVKRNSIAADGSVNTPSIKDKNKKKANVKRKRNNRSKAIIKFEKSAEQLIDERMRDAAVDVLNTSLEIRKSLESKVSKEPEPKLAMEHKMEGITDDEVKITENIEGNRVKKRQKRNEKALSLNKEKHSKKIKKTTLLNDTTGRTESPLPVLVVENMKPSHEDTANDSSFTPNMIQKFKKIYEERLDTIGCELNTTQNLLSDVDKNDDHNEQNSCSHMFNITEGLNQIPKCLWPTSKTSPLEEKQGLIKETEKSRKNNKSNKFIIQKELNKRLNYDSNQNEMNSSSEIINISGNTEINLEKSIDTVGTSPITAHGGLDLCKDDLPPSREFLETNIEPRNLEVDDLNQSIKDFFVNLNKQITEESHNIEDNPKSKFRESCLSNYEDKAVGKHTDTRILMSPLVSVTRLSSEEIIKWLPSHPNSDSASISIDLRNNLEPCVSNQTVDGTKNSNISITKSKECTKSTEKKDFRNSQISPIKLFDDIKAIAKQNSITSESNDYIKHIRNLFYNKKKVPSTIDGVQNPPPVHKIESSQDSKMSTSTKINASRASEKASVKSKSTKSVVESVENPLENINYWLRIPSAVRDIESSTSTIINASRVSEKTPIKIKSIKTSQDSKKRKVEVDDTQKISDSHPSISSVNDWLQRTVPTTSRAQSLDFAYKENILNVIEKLDSTLVEIHHNTNKKFINLFVEAQKQLNQLKAQRTTQYKQAAKDLLTDMVKLIDVKFSELDRRSQEMDEQFMEDLKERARKLIHDDCRQKGAMVTLLREDVQAVFDFVNKDKTKETLQK